MTLTIQRSKKASPSNRRVGFCKIVFTRLETGETIKRGCGRFGLMPIEGGWRCFYCGNYVYRPGASLEELWFHFRVGRDYWRTMSVEGKDFINGIPVAGRSDPLPPRLLADLSEARPPKWFVYFVLCDEERFQRYLETFENGQA